MQCRGTLIYGGLILSLSVLCSSSFQARAESGIASIYSNEKTANGEYAHATAFTAAHRTLPFGTFVEVTNTRTNFVRSVIIFPNGTARPSI